jgi:hypothetical protein
MQTFYVSMAADLLGVYIAFQAESITAVHQYLAKQYLRNGIWKIPWCAVYREKPVPRGYIPVIIVEAQCGTLFEQVTHAD